MAERVGAQRDSQHNTVIGTEVLPELQAKNFDSQYNDSEGASQLNDNLKHLGQFRHTQKSALSQNKIAAVKAQPPIGDS